MEDRSIAARRVDITGPPSFLEHISSKRNIIFSRGRVASGSGRDDEHRVVANSPLSSNRLCTLPIFMNDNNGSRAPVAPCAPGKLSAETMRRDDMCEYRVFSATQDAASRRDAASRPTARPVSTNWLPIYSVCPTVKHGGVYPRRVYTRPLQASDTRSPLIGRPRCSRWRTYPVVYPPPILTRASPSLPPYDFYLVPAETSPWKRKPGVFSLKLERC